MTQKQSDTTVNKEKNLLCGGPIVPAKTSMTTTIGDVFVKIDLKNAIMLSVTVVQIRTKYDS